MSKQFNIKEYSLSKITRSMISRYKIFRVNNKKTRKLIKIYRKQSYKDLRNFYKKLIKDGYF